MCLSDLKAGFTVSALCGYDTHNAASCGKRTALHCLFTGHACSIILHLNFMPNYWPTETKEVRRYRRSNTLNEKIELGSILVLQMIHVKKNKTNKNKTPHRAVLAGVILEKLLRGGAK